MKTNFSQAKSWIASAINDIKRVFNDLSLKDFSRVAFTSQLAVEKLNKAILSLIGIKIEKTHNPSEILKEVFIDEEALSIDEKAREWIEIIIRNSEFFERQGTKTRYGIIEGDKIRFPEEIYSSFEDIHNFLENLKTIINMYIKLMKETFRLSEKEFESIEVLKELEGEISKWI